MAQQNRERVRLALAMRDKLEVTVDEKLMLSGAGMPKTMEPAMSEAAVIFRPTEILHGFKRIGEAFGKGADAARRWEREGAPIVRDADKIPMCEKAELWQWIKQRRCAS